VAPERRALQNHRRDTRVGPDERGEREHRVADDPADDGGGKCVAEREIEVRRQHEHEERDAEVGPEQRRVEQPEHAQSVGHRLDSPRRRLLQVLRSLRWC
jgi:hypothetical protein